MSKIETEVCPEGTKVWPLCVGYLEADEAFLVRGGNTSLRSTREDSFVNKRRKVPMVAVLIEHPKAGLVLFETGGAKNYPETSGPTINDVFCRVEYKPEHDLAAAIASTGHDIKNIKAVIIGHAHLDHAGGLEWFKGTDVPIYCHELELKSAFYSVATGADEGVYLAHYLDLGLKWKTFDERTVDFAQGIVLHHFPGHTEGLMGIQINMPKSGSWVFTSDQYHVRENYEQGITQGFLARDHQAWFRSHNRIKRLNERLGARVVMGHDAEVFDEIWAELKGGPIE